MTVAVVHIWKGDKWDEEAVGLSNPKWNIGDQVRFRDFGVIERIHHYPGPSSLQRDKMIRKDDGTRIYYIRKDGYIHIVDERDIIG